MIAEIVLPAKNLPSRPFLAFLALMLSLNSTKIFTKTSASSDSSCFSWWKVSVQEGCVRLSLVSYLVDDNMVDFPIFVAFLLYILL